jgi:F-type H+-transporting ATPase subunit b
MEWIEWDATTAVALGFLIFAGILIYLKVQNTVLGALDERAAKIRNELEEAQRLREEAQALLASYERKQREALQEAESMRQYAREEAEREARLAAEKLEENLKRREQLALEKVALAEAQAEQQVRAAAVEAAIDAAARVIRGKLDDAAAGALVDDSIRDLRRHLN